MCVSGVEDQDGLCVLEWGGWPHAPGGRCSRQTAQRRHQWHLLTHKMAGP